MKTIKILLSLIVLTLNLSAQEVAVIYSSNLSESVASGAIVMQKYSNTTTYDVAGLDSASTYALVDGISDESVHKVFLCVDTATAQVSDQLQEHLYDSLDAKLYTTTTDGEEPDDDIIYIEESSTESKPEVTWERSDVYDGITKPLIIKYIGLDDFSLARGTASASSTDSTLVDSTKSWTEDEFAGDYVYITEGTGIGQYRVIDSNSDTSVLVTEEWDVSPSDDSEFIIKDDGESNELFYDIYADIYIRLYLSDLSSSETKSNWQKLLDSEKNLNISDITTPFQDLEYLWETVIAGGKNIFEYLAL